jgi:Mg/Co/Ni transporter MgtE
MSVLETLARELIHRRAEDAANIVSAMGVERAAAVLSVAEPADAAGVLIRMAPLFAAKCFQSMPVPTAGAIIDVLPPGVGANLLRSGDPEFVRNLLDRTAHRKRIEEHLRYPSLSVGEAMESTVPAVPLHWRVNSVRQALSELATPLCPYLYVVDESGVLRIQDLEGRGDAPLRQVMRTPVVRLQALSPLHSVVDHPAWSDYDVLPVTGRTDMPVGIIRHKDLRRHDAPPKRLTFDGESPADVLLSLGELYWSSLWSLVEGGGPAGTRPPVGSGRAR